MLKAVAAAHRTAAIARIEAKRSGFVISHFGRVGLCKEITDGIKGANVASRIRPCGFTDG